ncbi:tape measure protein [Chelatococcus asaccharovorans]|uniref:Tape measure protein N-terminal domain-containing protein n=1 Tax=Chelatococcus asaccharovorans TaxID=28210 RepID=A0A2V3UB45_9HYPH|nr:tape measure protein [Chelatococcus asaccharovorans]MBS7703332.1 hypothetical protein [Chelatococcus asaccharovorans]PXW61667.1 hypothetical protein C7450_103184 [Chelatococcus asaccharovorans]
MSNVAEILIRLIDEVTKPAKQVANALKGVTDSANGVQKATGPLQRLRDRLSAAIRPALELGRALRQAAATPVQSGLNGLTLLARQFDRVTASARRMAQALRESGISARMLKSGLTSLSAGTRQLAGGALRAGAIGTTIYLGKVAGAVAFVKTQLMDTQVEFEKYGAVLEAVTKSPEKAKTALQAMSDFAARTPYELGEVTDAFVRLSSYGVVNVSNMEDAIKTMRVLGDTAAAMGKTYEQAVEAMSDAQTGQNERLKEFGILANKEGSKVAFTFTDALGKQVTRSVKASDRNAIKKALLDIFDSKFAGSMDKMSRTLGGILSNLSDTWTRFKQMIVEAGVGDEIKRQLQSILDLWDDLNKQVTAPLQIGAPQWSLNKKMPWQPDNVKPEDTPTFQPRQGPSSFPMVSGTMSSGYQSEATGAQKLAQTVSDEIVKSLRQIRDVVMEVYGAFNQLYGMLDRVAKSPLVDAVGGWRAVLVTLLALPILSSGIQMGAGLVIMALGVSKLAAALGVLGAGAALQGVATLNTLTAGGLLAGLGKFALLAGKFMLVATAIAAVVTNWEKLAAIWQSDTGIFSKIDQSVATVVRQMTDWTGQLFGIEDLSGKLDAIEAKIASWGASVIAQIRSVFSIDLSALGAALINSLWTGMKKAGAALLDWAKGLAASIKNVFSNITFSATPATPNSEPPKTAPQNDPAGIFRSKPRVLGAPDSDAPPGKQGALPALPTTLGQAPVPAPTLALAMAVPQIKPPSLSIAPPSVTVRAPEVDLPDVTAVVPKPPPPTVQTVVPKIPLPAVPAPNLTVERPAAPTLTVPAPASRPQSSLAFDPGQAPAATNVEPVRRESIDNNTTINVTVDARGEGADNIARKIVAAVEGRTRRLNDGLNGGSFA